MSLNLDKSAWKRVAFGDVVKNLNVTVKNPGTEGINRVIAMEHLDPGELKISRWGDMEQGTSFTRRVRPCQTLFGKRRAYQRKAAYADFDAICSGDILVFEADSQEMLPEFLPFLVQSDRFYDHALGTSAGSLSPRTNWRDLSDYEFDLPALDEQGRVAALLWTIETHRASLKAAARALHRTQTEYIESESAGHSDVPLREWVPTIEAGRSPRAASSSAKGDEVGVLKVSAAGDGVFIPEENKRLLDRKDFRSDLSVRAGDLLVTRANAVVDNVARPCVVHRDEPNLMLSDKTLRLVPKAQYPTRVVLEALRTRAYRNHVRESVGGTEAKNISQEKILAGPVPDWDAAELSRIRDSLGRSDEAIRNVATEANALRTVRNAIMGSIFGGRS